MVRIIARSPRGYSSGITSTLLIHEPELSSTTKNKKTNKCTFRKIYIYSFSLHIDGHLFICYLFLIFNATSFLLLLHVILCPITIGMPQ